MSRVKIRHTLSEVIRTLQYENYIYEYMEKTEDKLRKHELNDKLMRLNIKVRRAQQIAYKGESDFLLDMLRDIADSEELRFVVSLKEEAQGYETKSFRCKSDFDTCIRNAKGKLEQALCYALFIHCLVKK